jgi:hypothetical protein
MYVILKCSKSCHHQSQNPENEFEIPQVKFRQVTQLSSFNPLWQVAPKSLHLLGIPEGLESVVVE